MLQKLLQMANTAKHTISKAGQQLKSEKININKTNNSTYKDETKAHFDHVQNFKEYSEIIKDVYVNDTFKKLKSLAKKEKEIYMSQLQKTFPKETMTQYKSKIYNSMNTVKNYSFWNSNQKQTNQTKQQESPKSSGWKSYFNKVQNDASNINQQYKQNINEQKDMFQKFKDAKFKTWNFILENSVSKAKQAGKVSFKYILIGVFVFGFAYAIPKSIASYFATKAAISAQLQIENLKKENESLRLALSVLQSQNGQQKNNNSRQ